MSMMVFVFPCAPWGPMETEEYRVKLQDHERMNGKPLQARMWHQSHLLFNWVYELIHHPKIRDAVKGIVGPDILCWSTNFFIKEPNNDGNFVSWHQDATYWGLEPHDQVITAWLALSDVPLESGPMKFLAGSHNIGLAAHEDTFHGNNLLTRGQEMDLDVNEDDAVDVVLKAGEFSLHHVLLAHGSHPNTTDKRRIGLAIRYIPTTARQTKLRDMATLVRGFDEHDNFDLLPGPRFDLDDNAIARHTDSTNRLQANLYSGTGKTKFRS